MRTAELKNNTADSKSILAAEQEARVMLAMMLLHANLVEFLDRLQKILSDQHLGNLSGTDALCKLRTLYAQLISGNEKLRHLGTVLPDELP